MGPIPQHKPRADFSTGFFEVAAFEVIKNDGHETTADAAKAARESGADVVVICLQMIRILNWFHHLRKN